MRLQPRIGGFDGPDPGEPQVLWQPALQRAEHPLGAPARLRRIRRDMLDPKMRQGPSHLGWLGPRYLLASLRSVEVMAAAIGVERAEQTMLADHLAQGLERRCRPFFLDQQHR